MGLGTVEVGDGFGYCGVRRCLTVVLCLPALGCREEGAAEGQGCARVCRSTGGAQANCWFGTLEVGDVVVGTVEVGDDALTSHASGSSTCSSGGACGKVRGRVWEEGPGRVGDSLSPLARAMCFRNQNRCCRTASRRCARRMFSST